MGFHLPNFSVFNCTLEGVLLRTAHARQFFGLLLIPTLVLGVDGTPRTCEWVGRMG